MIVTELMGGMGNQMFQYALGRHLAVKHKTFLYLDIQFLLDRSPRKNFVYRDYDLNIFNIQANIASREISDNYSLSRPKLKKAIQKFITPRHLQRVTEIDFKFNSSVLKSEDNIYLNGYWQTEKYFKDIDGIIRSDFTFKEQMTEAAKVLAKEIINHNAVCLNVRRGDFVNNPTHGIIGLDYYLKAEQYLLNHIANPVFYVFSDDIYWCRKNIFLSSETRYVDHTFAGKKFRDYLELMSLCKYFVIPNSSFAWWAAWLAVNPDKIIIAPKVWFHGSKWDTSDLLPEKWIKI